MNKTKQLRDSLEAVMKSFADIPYCYLHALPLVKPPYCVYQLKLILKNGCIEQYYLTLDISGVGLDGDAVDEIADRIAAGMDYLTWTDEHQSWECYQEDNDSIDEKDINIQRRRLRFEVRYMERKNESWD